MKKVTKFGLEVLTGKALSFWLEFIDKTGEKVFRFQMQITFVTLFSWIVLNKLKTKFNIFLQNDFKYKKNSQLLLKKLPRKSYTNAFKVLFVAKKKRRPRLFGHRALKL